MDAVSNKKSRYYRHPALNGLSDKDLISIYKIGSIKKIDPGGVIVKEDDTDKTIFLILGGSVKIIDNLSGQDKKIAILRQGDWVGEIAFIKQNHKTVSALATKPVTVLALDEQSMHALAPKTQLLIYRNLYDLAKQRINSFIISEAALVDKNNYLTARVRTFLQAKIDEYEGAEIIQNILRGIPRLPMYATKLAVMLRDEDVSTSDVVKFAALDPSLVGVVMKTVNSPYYNLRNKVTDLQHAVLLLGFSQVYQLVIADGVRSVMPATRGFRELQFHSAVVSFLCFEISQLCDKKQAPMLSTIGLLHDIGKSVILLLKKQYPKMTLLIDMMDHASIGALLLKKWDLPDVICQSIRYQHYPEVLPPSEIPVEHQKDVAVLHIAHLCYEYLKGQEEIVLSAAFLREYMDTLKLTEGTLTEFVKKKILPSINKKKNTLPEDVRQFFKKGETQLIAHRFEDGLWGSS